MLGLELGEKETPLDRAERRVKFIPRLLGRGFFVPRDLLHGVVTRSLTRLFTESYKLEGEERLKEAIDLSLTKRLVINSNHQSDVDHPAIRYILEQRGYGEFVDRWLYFAGVKMTERFETKIFLGGENMVYVSTPFDKREIEGVLGGSSNQGLSEQERDTFRQYKELGEQLDRRSIRKAANWVRRTNGVVVFYPEATRSRHKDGLVQRGQKEVEPLYRLGDVVLPMMIIGTSEVFPVEKKFIFGRRMRLTLIVGEPYSVEELLNAATQKTLEEEFNAKPVDLAMARIGRLRWTMVDPEYVDLYQAIDQRLPTQSLAA